MKASVPTLSPGAWVDTGASEGVQSTQQKGAPGHGSSCWAIRGACFQNPPFKAVQKPVTPFRVHSRIKVEAASGSGEASCPDSEGAIYAALEREGGRCTHGAGAVLGFRPSPPLCEQVLEESDRRTPPPPPHVRCSLARCCGVLWGDRARAAQPGRED